MQIFKRCQLKIHIWITFNWGRKSGKSIFFNVFGLGFDLGYPADAARHRGSDPGLHRRRGRDQPDPVGRHSTRLDR